MGVLRVLLQGLGVGEVYGVVLASSATPFCDDGCRNRWWWHWHQRWWGCLVLVRLPSLVLWVLLVMALLAV